MASSLHGANGHHGAGIAEIPTHREVALDVLRRYQETSPRYWGWVAVLGILFLLGVVGFVIRVGDGFDDTSDWSYFVGTMAFITTVFASPPIISSGLRLVKAHWRRPMTRVTEVYGVSSLFILLMLIPALAVLPPLDPDGKGPEDRGDIWFNFPGAPGTYDIIAFAALALVGIGFLWMLTLPDLAAARDHLPLSGRQRIVSLLSLGWVGHVRQWRVLRLGVILLGAFYMLTFMLVQTLLSADFALGLVPGWKDAIFPAFMVLASLQGGVGMTLITLYVLRRAGGYERYLSIDQFWSLSKPLLAFSLLWFYFWWSSFITFWYGRLPSERDVLDLMYFGPYRTVFMISFVLNFLVPLIALVWNPVRRSVLGPSLVGLSVVLGAFFTMTRVYVAAMSVEDPNGRVLKAMPGFQGPTVPDALIAIGGIAGSVLLFLIVIKIVPVISIWEVGEGLRLTKVRRFYGRMVRVIAKSH